MFYVDLMVILKDTLQLEGHPKNTRKTFNIVASDNFPW